MGQQKSRFVGRSADINLPSTGPRDPRISAALSAQVDALVAAHPELSVDDVVAIVKGEKQVPTSRVGEIAGGVGRGVGNLMTGLARIPQIMTNPTEMAMTASQYGQHLGDKFQQFQNVPPGPLSGLEKAGRGADIIANVLGMDPGAVADSLVAGDYGGAAEAAVPLAAAAYFGPKPSRLTNLVPGGVRSAMASRFAEAAIPTPRPFAGVGSPVSPGPSIPTSNPFMGRVPEPGTALMRRSTLPPQTGAPGQVPEGLVPGAKIMAPESKWVTAYEGNFGAEPPPGPWPYGITPGPGRVVPPAEVPSTALVPRPIRTGPGPTINTPGRSGVQPFPAELVPPGAPSLVEQILLRLLAQGR